MDNCVPLANGEFNLKANQKTIIPESPNRVFTNFGFVGLPLGFHKLDNPRLIVDETLIEFTFELGTVKGYENNWYVYVGLHGTITTQ